MKRLRDFLAAMEQSTDRLHRILAEAEVKAYQQVFWLREALAKLGVDEPVASHELNLSKKALLDRKLRQGTNRDQLREREQRLKEQAMDGVERVDREPRGDGRPGTAIRIDGGPVVFLPPSLAKLLDLIEADYGESPDDLVGFKSTDLLIEKIWGKPTDMDHAKHALSERLSKLKALLKRHGYNRHLVEIDRERGIRFARHRSS